MTPADDHPDLSALEREVMQAGMAREERSSAEPTYRRSHGIVHTPPLLARAMALRADEVLRSKLGKPLGVADSAVSVIDPACGPGAFLAAVRGVVTGSRARPAGVVGCDLDAQAIETARGLLGPAFAADHLPLDLRVVDTLAERPRAALLGRAKTLVVIGNPPWASKSKSRGHVVSEGMLADFRREPDGSPLRERKVGVLSDDYVRFIRWGAEAVRQAPGGGVLAFVTNSSWLDGPVHRGMRACLLRWFTGIDVYDLGGSALLARDAGTRDENVFGVRPGVAVFVAHRLPKHGELIEGASVRYMRLLGARAEKLEALSDLARQPEALPRTSSAFVFRRTGVKRAWPTSIALDEAMPFHREGVQTNRDDVAVAASREELLARLRSFAGKKRAKELDAMRKGSGHYDPVIARERVAEALAEAPDGGRAARKLAYRPFDTRWFVPIAPLCHRPRPDLLAAMSHATFALVTVRKDRSERVWSHLGVVTDVPDNCYLSNRSSCRARAFPTHGPDGRPNFEDAARDALVRVARRDVDVIDFARFAAAVLASSTYRTTYDASLREAPPRLPVPTSKEAFEALVAAGAAVIAAFSTPGGEHSAVIGHYQVEGAPSGLAPAFALAESAYVQAFAREV